MKDTETIKKIQPADQQFPEPNNEVTDIIFVMHGIRDLGYWTSKVARKVKSHPYHPKPGETQKNIQYYPLLFVVIVNHEIAMKGLGN